MRISITGVAIRTRNIRLYFGEALFFLDADISIPHDPDQRLVSNSSYCYFRHFRGTIRIT